MKNLICIFVVCLTLGCRPESGVLTDQGAGLRITYEDSAVADLYVRLYTSVDAVPIAQAVTDQTGTARFGKLANLSPGPWLITLDTVADGGWFLDPRFIDPATSQLSIDRLDDAKPPEIQLPRGAIRTVQ